MSIHHSDAHDTPEASELDDAWKLIRSIRFVMFTTRDEHGLLRSRPMTVQDAARDDEDLWFFMSRSSDAVVQIGREPRVNVAYSDTSADAYASVSGTATVVEDAALKNKLFSPMVKVWFPDGPADPDLALVRVSILELEYWLVRENKLVQLLKFARAAATGKRPELGEHGTVTG